MRSGLSWRARLVIRAAMMRWPMIGTPMPRSEIFSSWTPSSTHFWPAVSGWCQGGMRMVIWWPRAAKARAAGRARRSMVPFGARPKGPRKRMLRPASDSAQAPAPPSANCGRGVRGDEGRSVSYSTVTLLARLRGWSTVATKGEGSVVGPRAGREPSRRRA